jgi:membrane-bound lytic murein transglycosylase D
MLKTKHPRAGVLCHGLMLVSLSAGANAIQDPADSFRNGKTATPQKHQYTQDTTVLQAQAPDSPAIAREHIAEKEAPALPAIRLNSQAANFVKLYLEKNDETLVKVKERSKSYFQIMDTILYRYGLPLELKYLAVVESKLKSTAVSRAGASGPWQIMPSTARCLGLKVTSRNDERNHTWKSTQAAAKYLKYLYGEFDDWLLVIAAYNAGPGKVQKAIRLSGSRNFWKLQYFLPTETRLHVKRFIGAHCYFEGGAGITTMTKAERLEHQKAVVLALNAREKAAEDEQQALVER